MEHVRQLGELNKAHEGTKRENKQERKIREVCGVFLAANYMNAAPLQLRICRSEKSTLCPSEMQSLASTSRRAFLALNDVVRPLMVRPMLERRFICLLRDTFYIPLVEMVLRDA